MHILVLGGNGFIGAHFVAAAVDAGCSVSVLSQRERPVFAHGRPFRHLPGRFEALFANPDWLDGVDAVCHCAWSSVPKTAAADPQGDVTTNVIGTLKLLNLLRDRPDIKHLMFLSSGGAVYGNTDQQAPIREDQPLRPIGAYGVAKVAAESYCRIFGAETGRDVTILRPSNPYGPGQNTVGVLGVVSTFMHHALSGTAATMFGDGSVMRDFLHVSDLAKLMVEAFQSPAPGTYNIGSGTGTSLAEVADAVEAVTGRTLHVDRKPERPFDPKRIVLDITSAGEAFSWTPEIGLEAGVRSLLQSH